MSAKASEISQLSRIAAGDESAFTQLFANTSPVVYRYLMRVTGNRDKADTFCILTYQQAWIHAEQFDHNMPPGNWLVMLAREQVLASMSDPTESQQDQAAAKMNVVALDRQKLFVSAMNSLPMTSRDILTLVLMPMYTYHAISEIMGITIDEVKTHVFDAKQLLKEKLRLLGIKKSEVSRSNILRELIPLYVNGALAGKHKLAFEKSLKNDPNLKQEYMEFYEIESYFDQLESVSKQHLDQLYLAVTNSLEELSEVEEAEYEHEKLPKISIDFLHHLLSSARIGWGLAMLQFVILLIVVIFMGSEDSKPVEANKNPAQYIQQQHRNGRKINVIFQDSATHKQIRDLLLKHKAEIFSGPTDIGLYTIIVDVNERAAEKLVKQLRSSSIILLVESAY